MISCWVGNAVGFEPPEISATPRKIRFDDGGMGGLAALDAVVAAGLGFYNNLDSNIKKKSENEETSVLYWLEERGMAM